MGKITLDELATMIKREFDGVHKDIGELKSDIAVLKENVADLNDKVDNLDRRFDHFVPYSEFDEFKTGTTLKFKKVGVK